MLTNSPNFRAAIYIAAVVAQVLAFLVRAADPSGVWSSALQQTANFLGAIAGVTAMGNLATGPVVIDGEVTSSSTTPR